MMSIHTVAAGGGSILHFDGSALSRRARTPPAPIPGPACYRRGGPLTVTDCNVMLGKIQPDVLPARVRAGRRRAARRRRRARASSPRWRRRSRRPPATRARPRRSPRASCDIAVGNMANAIKQHLGAARPRRHRVHAVLLRRRGRPARLPGGRRAGHDARVHPSARRRAVGLRHGPRRHHRDARAGGRGHARGAATATPSLDELERLGAEARTELLAPGRAGRPRDASIGRVHLRYDGTDTSLIVRFGTLAEMVGGFEAAYRKRYSLPDARPRADRRGRVGRGDRRLRRARGAHARRPASARARRRPRTPCRCSPAASRTRRRSTRASGCSRATPIHGPAIIAEANATTVVEPGWEARVTPLDHLRARAHRGAPEARRRSAPASTR